MKKFFLPLLIAAMLSTLVAVPDSGYAASKADKLKAQLNDIDKKIKKAKNDAEYAESQVNKLNKNVKNEKKNLETLLSEIEKAGEELQKLEGEVSQTEQELHQAAEELDAAIVRVDTRDALLKNRMRLMYMSGFVEYIDVLFSATDFSDFLDRYRSISSIVSRDKDILAENKRDRQLIAETKESIELGLAKLNRLQELAEIHREKLLATEKNKRVLIASMSEKIEEFEHITEEQEKELMKLASEKKKINDELRKEQLKGISGELGYPLSDVRPVTSWFGQRTDPVTGKKGAQHNGIDFGAPQGTPILAAGDGEVIVAQWWNGYGNTVIIDHGNMWTLYGHIMPNGILVKEGQAIKKGQQIAKVGTTGKSTGYHLHFEVRINEKAVDPRKYLGL